MLCMLAAGEVESIAGTPTKNDEIGRRGLIHIRMGLRGIWVKQKDEGGLSAKCTSAKEIRQHFGPLQESIGVWCPLQINSKLKSK